MRQTVLPVLERTLVRLGATKRTFCENVIAERDLERWRRMRGIQIEVQPVSKNDLNTAEVHEQQVEAHVQPGAAATEQRRANLEQWPAIHGQHLMGHPLPDRLDVATCL